MNFEIVPNEQTPKVPLITFSDGKLFVEEHREEFEAFLEFAKGQLTAVGLAANQCTLNGERFMHRVFALRDLNTEKFSLIIDPHITRYIGIKELKAEGCLTWKNRRILAERYRAVEVDYLTMDGKRTVKDIRKGFEGQIWQHEINHLNGVEENVDYFDTPNPKPISVERNALCPCGSGLKYKKCCLPLL
jgi:peptide deformylase